MKYLTTLSITATLLVFILTLILTATIAIRFGPIGADYNAHRRIAERYAAGDAALFDEQILAENKIPYPPLFHLLLAGAISLGIIVPVEFLLQLLAYPLVLFAPAYLMYKMKGMVPATIVLLLLFGSLALFDRGQVAPQTVDLILFPFAILAFLTNRTTLMSILLLVMVYTHGAYSLLLFGGLFLYALFKKKHLKPLAITLILCLPAIILTLIYLPTALSTGFGINDPQEALLANNPLYLFTYLGPLLCVFSLIALLSILNTKDETLTLLLFWLAALIPILILFPDRFASYAAAPLALIIGIAYCSHRKLLEPYAIPLLGILFIFGLITVYLFWFKQAVSASSYIFQT
jgi:hypothetical protein